MPFSLKNIIALFLLSVLMVTGLFLGNWQLQRLAWKEGLLEQIAYKQVEPSVPFSEISGQAASDVLWRHASVTFTPTDNPVVQLWPRTHDGKSGFDVISTVETSSGSLWVDWGWLPFDKKEEWHFATLPKQSVSLDIVLRPLPERQFMTPINQEDQGIFYSLEPKEFPWNVTYTGYMAQRLQGGEDLFAEKTAPEVVSVAVNLPNNHKQYAIFWFVMSGLVLLIMCVMTYSMFRKVV